MAKKRGGLVSILVAGAGATAADLIAGQDAAIGYLAGVVVGYA